MTNRKKVIAVLEELAIPYRIVNHPAVFTVAESEEHVKDKRPIKNLLLQEKGNGKKVLVSMDGNQRLNSKLLAHHLKTRKLSFTNADVLMQTLGVEPGAVSIFGLLNNDSQDVEFVVDESLLAEEELGFHPNENTSTVFISSKALKKIVEHTHHTLHVLSLAAKQF